MTKIRSYIFMALLIAFPVISMAFEMEPEMKKYLDTAEVSEDGVPSGIVNLTSYPFRDYLTANWRSILENVETIAPSPRQQSVLMATATLLPSEDYLQFIALTFNKLEYGKLNKMAVRNGVIFPGPLRYGFLATNYQNPEVQNICEIAKRIFPEDPPLQQYINAILSGAAKVEAEKWASANNRKMPEVLAINANIRKSNMLLGDPSMEVVERTASTKKVSPSSSPTAETKSTPWSWIIGAILVLAVVGGILFKFLRK